MQLIVILGPTASGKTKLATHVAAKMNAEIISADSRQVYRRMDLGTGKDLKDFEVNGKKIPYHLIDILPAGAKYNLKDYQQDFKKVYTDLVNKHCQAVLVGGTGMYIEAVLKDYKNTAIPVNENLRNELRDLDKSELTQRLEQINTRQQKFDLSTKKRLIRAIEICQHQNEHPQHTATENLDINYKIFGISMPRERVLERIHLRIEHRINEGMIEEVKGLINEGVPNETLKYYGLEYKIITEYLEGKYEFGEMVEKLNIGIRQFAKRQMTWFRKMQRNGFEITWVDGNQPLPDQVNEVLESIN